MVKRLFVILMAGVISMVAAGCSLKGSEDKDKYTATVEAESYYIPVEVPGKITDVFVKQGDKVKVGDKVAQIDTTSLELQKKQAEAALSIAKLKQEDLPSGTKDNLKGQAQAAVDQAQASADLIQNQINKAAVTAVLEGTISDVLIHKGEMAAAGMNVARVIDLKNKYIKVYIEESKRNAVKLGDVLSLYAEGKVVSEGKIVFIASESEFTPKNVEKKSDKEKTVFQIKLGLSEVEELQPGMLVDVVIK